MICTCSWSGDQSAILSRDRDEHPVLTFKKPDVEGDFPCIVNVKFPCVGMMASVLIFCTARIIEVYRGEAKEYVTTSRGTYRDFDDLYHHDIDFEKISLQFNTNMLSFKFLSLDNPHELVLGIINLLSWKEEIQDLVDYSISDALHAQIGAMLMNTSLKSTSKPASAETKESTKSQNEADLEERMRAYVDEKVEGLRVSFQSQLDMLFQLAKTSLMKP